MTYYNIDVLTGKTLISIDGGVGDDEMIFRTTDGETYMMYHKQDCCENVSVEDITGELEDLIGSKICMAEESTSDDFEKGHTSATWTFYKLATIKGYVDIRWCGSSNGYYSEDVYFKKV